MSGASGASSGGAAAAAGRGVSGSAGVPSGAGTAGKGDLPQGGSDGGAGASAGGVDAGGPSGGSPSAGSANGGSPGAAGTVTSGGVGGADPSAAGQGGRSDCDGDAREVCDALDNDCDGEVDEGSACPDGCKGRAVDGRSYMFCLGDAEFFEDASAACGDAGMHLAWIESAEENAAIAKAAEELGTTAERVWIGGSDADDERSWHWVDGSGQPQTAFWSGGTPEDGGDPVEGRYVNWGEDRPNGSSQGTDEDCLSFTLNRSGLARGAWNDDVCRESWPYVCEP